MASRNKDERAHVNALVKALQKNSPGAGNVRHTSSGWDFFIAAHFATNALFLLWFELENQKSKAEQK